MFQSPESLSRIRSLCLGLTGLMCLAYALFALVTEKTAPISGWWLSTVGLTAALIIFVSFIMAGRRVAERAVDERYQVNDLRAHRIAYWFALFLYPLFGLLIQQGLISLGLAFHVMAALTGAAYLIPHTVLTGYYS